MLLQDTRVIVRGDVAGASIQLPGDVLKIGTYWLELRDATGATIETATVLVAPARAFTGYFDRSWLLTTQLYSLVSDRNWGIGDFTDLANLIRIAAAQGCAGIGLNPLHALFEDDPTGSPYAPNSRLFLNPLYIDVEALPEFIDVSLASADGRRDRRATCGAADRLSVDGQAEDVGAAARVRGVPA